jgi:TPP-dependent 2-oxoacid decarboxylase
LEKIDRVFNACLRYKRPVYIELPRDIVRVPAGRGFLVKTEEELGQR